jgi:hypothetical protein
MVQRAHVSPKVIEGAKRALAYHEWQILQESQSQEAFHQEMITHYRLLLQYWEENR